MKSLKKGLLVNFISNYSRKETNKEIDSDIHLEFQSLCLLRNYIFYEKKFNIQELSNKLLIFPMKYLNIVINNYDESYFPISKMDFSYSFKLEYNNNFIRIQINRIIDEIFKGVTSLPINSFKGSGEGCFLELKVNEYFREKSSQKLGINGLECRALFSLVTIPNINSSKETIIKHRQKEAKLLFFGKNEYNILIDDIDKDEILKNNQDHYNLKKNYYYFSQISLTGKAFDMCIIERENKNIFKLYLFQVSKNKTQELQTNYYYLLQADSVAQNFKNLYNIVCEKRYLIFILPKISDTREFIGNLELNNYFYIFYDDFTNNFYDKNGQILKGLVFEDALINIKSKNEIKDLEKIKQNKKIWDNSMKAFINKKRSNNKSLYQIYINNYYNFNKYNQIKLILSKQLKELLVNEIIQQNDAIFKFIGNIKLKNLDSIKYLYKMIIIFKTNEELYIIYDSKYKLEEKNNILSLQQIKNEKLEDKIKSSLLKEEPLLNIKSSKQKYSKIYLKDLIEKKKYNNECFCYLIITKEIVKEYYQSWC